MDSRWDKVIHQILPLIIDYGEIFLFLGGGVASAKHEAQAKL